MNITLQEFVNMIKARPGAIILSMSSATPLKLKRSYDGPEITKLSTINGVVNFSYQNSVNRQRQREGNQEEFVAEERRWGERVYVDGRRTPFVTHNDKIYLSIKIESTREPRYVDSDGNTINRELFREYEYARNHSSRQNVENEVIVRDYDLSHLVSVKLNGEEYHIIHNGPVNV